jgi:hypothetical protein
VAALILRGLLAWDVHSVFGSKESRHNLLWLPVRECLSLTVWLAGWLGRRITWRGRVFKLRSDGRLEIV